MATQEVSVSLGSSIVYVTGTVNGTAYTFTLSGTTNNNTLWSAVVDRDDNDVYIISITAIDSMGNTTTVNTTMYYGIMALVTDRTTYDVEQWRVLRDKGYDAMTDEERALWDSGSMKGAYNVSDLNRVGSALNYIRDRLAAAGYVASDIFTAKSNWSIGEVPTAANLTDYLNAVETVRSAMSRFGTTPKTPKNTGSLDYMEANNIEKILFDVNTLITNMLQARHYCGDLFSGEV